MCAHLIARWLKEEILNIFLDKNRPGWSWQECFLSPFKTLYSPGVRIVQGLENQNLWANSGTPDFMCLLHLQSPVSYYYWQNTQGLHAGFLLSTAKPDSFIATSSREGQLSYARWIIHREFLCTSLTGLMRGGYLLYRIPVCQHFFLKWVDCSDAEVWYQTTCMNSCWVGLKVSKMTERGIPFFSLISSEQGVPHPREVLQPWIMVPGPLLGGYLFAFVLLAAQGLAPE